MARVEIASAAVEDLERLIAVLSLPADTRDRVRTSIAPLAQFPLLGQELSGRWRDLRFVLGPWRWMLIVYDYDEGADRVVTLTIQDAPLVVGRYTSRIC
ncbi:MAG: type II toxin-antitoxin system RelE/ParE family toxin [Actinomycetota bacterium]|nr:type II toxin-antitoxin system RelE/ParE family toxin [Actinomycetota bacterium]